MGSATAVTDRGVATAGPRSACRGQYARRRILSRRARRRRRLEPRDQLLRLGEERPRARARRSPSPAERPRRAPGPRHRPARRARDSPRATTRRRPPHEVVEEAVRPISPAGAQGRSRGSAPPASRSRPCSGRGGGTARARSRRSRRRRRRPRRAAVRPASRASRASPALSGRARRRALRQARVRDGAVVALEEVLHADLPVGRVLVGDRPCGSAARRRRGRRRRAAPAAPRAPPRAAAAVGSGLTKTNGPQVSTETWTRPSPSRSKPGSRSARGALRRDAVQAVRPRVVRALDRLAAARPRRRAGGPVPADVHEPAEDVVAGAREHDGQGAGRTPWSAGRAPRPGRGARRTAS